MQEPALDPGSWSRENPTLHKLARIFDFMLRDKRPYQHTDAERDQEQFRAREVKNLQRKAAKLGFALNPLPESVVT